METLERKHVTPYIILILAADVVVLAGMTVHGCRQGFAGTISRVISLIASIAVIMLVSSIVQGYQNGNTSNLIIGILLLIIMGAVYKLIHAVLTSIRFLAGLPILGGLDKILGIAAGFIEGFAILYAAEYLLRMYLLQ